MIKKFINFDIEYATDDYNRTTLKFTRLSREFDKIRGKGIINLNYNNVGIWSRVFPKYYPENGLALPGRETFYDFSPFYCSDVEELNIILNLLEQLDEYIIPDSEKPLNLYKIF